MIRNLRIAGCASYDAAGQTLSNLLPINFVYGANATGKTTISRVIHDATAFPSCTVEWTGGAPLEALVYNRDFVERNFNQHDELKGIFTLGEKDKDTLDKIATAKRELDAVEDSIASLTKSLSGEDGDGGKKAELEELEREFEEKCWTDLKQKYDETLQGAFAGVRGKKRDFKARLLREASENTSDLLPLDNLEKKARTVFGDTPEPATPLSVPSTDDLVGHESNAVLKKKVVGKSDVDIAAMIQKLGNSDWVKQGRAFYEGNDRICPFCQQETDEAFERSLNEYFDQAFETDTANIATLQTDYRSDAERLQRSIQALIDNPSEFLDVDKLKSEAELLKSNLVLNSQRIEEKRREPSKVMELKSLSNILETIKGLLVSANTKIAEHNEMVANLATEKRTLTGQVWKSLLNEFQTDLSTYTTKKAGLDKAINSLNEQISEKNREKQVKMQQIAALEKDRTSIQPTIDNINALLKTFGFRGFELAKSERDRFYRIRRPDGADAKETLSEGEASFISFLYFYHRIKGSETESGMTTDRVVVFDDPVSSLDSDVLFIVSNLIKGLFDEVRAKEGTVKQIFVLTHNVYFHREVTFSAKRTGGQRLKDETFWTVRKTNNVSRLHKHPENPIKTSYELLWSEVKNGERDNLSIQNNLRRILEHYFKILGGVDSDQICEMFDGKKKLVCKSLFSWVNAGSHHVHDDLYLSIDDAMIKTYLDVFRAIFDKTDNLAHYNMMMGEDPGGMRSRDQGALPGE